MRLSMVFISDCTNYRFGQKLQRLFFFCLLKYILEAFNYNSKSKTQHCVQNVPWHALLMYSRIPFLFKCCVKLFTCLQIFWGFIKSCVYSRHYKLNYFYVYLGSISALENTRGFPKRLVIFWSPLLQRTLKSFSLWKKNSKCVIFFRVRCQTYAFTVLSAFAFALRSLIVLLTLFCVYTPPSVLSSFEWESRTFKGL